MSVRLSKPDADAGDVLAELDATCAVAGWSVSAYRAILQSRLWDCRIAMLEGRPVGYYVSRVLPPEVELMTIGVIPAEQGRGLGKLLLDECLAEAVSRGCRRCFLEVRRSNHRAIRFYQGNGFVTCFVRRGYYVNPGEDALVFERRLERPIG